jgi:hypothetical protein
MSTSSIVYFTLHVLHCGGALRAQAYSLSSSFIISPFRLCAASTPALSLLIIWPSSGMYVAKSTEEREDPEPPPIIGGRLFMGPTQPIQSRQVGMWWMGGLFSTARSCVHLAR